VEASKSFVIVTGEFQSIIAALTSVVEPAQATMKAVNTAILHERNFIPTVISFIKLGSFSINARY
jgi:hypothetical protein